MNKKDIYKIFDQYINYIKNSLYIDIKDNMYTLEFKYKNLNNEEINSKLVFNNINIANFINLLNRINKINSMGYNIIYYDFNSNKLILNKKELKFQDIENIYNEDYNKYKEEVFNEIEKINKKFLYIREKIIFINDSITTNDKNLINIKEEIERSKKLIYSQKLLTKTKYKYPENIANLDIDLNEILNIIKSNNLKELNDKIDYIDKYLNLSYKINLSDFNNINNIDDIYIIKTFVNVLNDIVNNYLNELNNNENIIKANNNIIDNLIETINYKTKNDISNLVIPQLTSVNKIKLSNIDSIYDLFSFELNSNEKDNTDSILDNFKNIKYGQFEKLTNEEILALNYYIEQLYLPINLIILYQRSSNSYFDDNVKGYIYQGYEDLKNNVKPLFIENNELISIEKYQEYVMKFIPYVISSLDKVITSKQIEVYTNYENEFDKSIIIADINKLNYNSKLIIPGGSKLIIFDDKKFGDVNDRELIDINNIKVIIDGSQYDFEKLDNNTYKLKIKTDTFEDKF